MEVFPTIFFLNTLEAQFVTACVVRNKLKILTASHSNRIPPHNHTHTLTHSLLLCDGSQINEFMRMPFCHARSWCKRTCAARCHTRWNSIYVKSLRVKKKWLNSYLCASIHQLVHRRRACVDFRYSVIRMTCAYCHHILRQFSSIRSPLTTIIMLGGRM